MTNINLTQQETRVKGSDGIQVCCDEVVDSADNMLSLGLGICFLSKHGRFEFVNVYVPIRARGFVCGALLYIDTCGGRLGVIVAFRIRRAVVYVVRVLSAVALVQADAKAVLENKLCKNAIRFRQRTCLI